MTKNKKILEGFMRVLHAIGYDCTQGVKTINIAKDDVALMSLDDKGTFKSLSDSSVNYAAEIWEIHKNVKESYNLYYKAEQVEYEQLKHYRKLADFNGFMLAARMRSDNCLEFATWEKARINTRNGMGSYFDYYGHAKEDFAVRAGLVSHDRLKSAADETNKENNERRELSLLDNEKFTKLLTDEIKKRGYDCTIENGEIKVSKNGFPVTDILGDGQYRIYKNVLNDYDLNQIRTIHDSVSEAYWNYAKGEPLPAQPDYHKMCELGKIVLAAKMMNYGYLEYVTWQQDLEKTRVDAGHYFTDYEAAKEDFASRAGLIDRNKLFTETEMKLIRQGLVHLGINFPDLTHEQNTLLGKVVEKIEMIVPEIQEHEALEHHELAPDDGLEI
jgi:hypothetical protein